MEDSLEDYIKISSSKKDKEQDLSNKVREDILITAQRKKECENQAMQVVQLLIDGQLQPQVFLHCLRRLNPELYQDIVEERSITNMCGYAICGNKIPQMPKKQFHISSKANKVYDISDRKNYCSNFCYKASVHIKKQIDTSPLWLRNREEIPNFKLLPATTPGVPGELIDHGIAKPVIEPKFTSVSSFAHLGLNEIETLEMSTNMMNEERKKENGVKVTSDVPKMSAINEEEDFISEKDEEEKLPNEVEGSYKIGNVVKKTPNSPSINKVTDELNNMSIKCDKKKKRLSLDEIIAKHRASKENNKKGIKTIDISEIVEKSPGSSKNVKNSINVEVKSIKKKIQINKEPTDKIIAKSKKQTKPSTIKSDANDEEKECAAKNEQQQLYDESLRNIFDSLKQWLTIDSFKYLYGEERVKQILNEKKLLEYFDKLKITELETAQQIKYMEICKKLQLKELADEQLDQKILSRKLQPLPDYKQLKEENKDLTLKVKSFYCGVLFEKPDSKSKTKINSNKNDEENTDNSNEEGTPAVLPLVDANSQAALRRKVFLRSIHRKLVTHLDSLQLDTTLLIEEVQELVRTFKLSAKNVIFKPAAWEAVALTLIKLLSIKNVDFKTKLDNKHSHDYIQSVLGKLEGYELFLKDVVNLIEDLEGFMETYVISH